MYVYIVYIYIYLHIHDFISMYLYIYIYTSLYTFIYSMHIKMYSCIHIFNGQYVEYMYIMTWDYAEWQTSIYTNIVQILFLGF